MKFNKDLLKKHLITVCAVLSLASLFLPFFTMKIESSYLGDFGENISLIDFILDGGWYGIITFLTPVILVVFNYVKPLSSLKKVACIAAPAVSLVTVVASCFFASGVYYDVTIAPSAGFFISLIANIGAILCSVFLFDSNSENADVEKGKKVAKEKIKKVKNVATDKVGDVASSAATVVKEQAELTSLKAEINVIDKELNASYSMVGKKFVEYVIATQEMPAIDVSDILKWIDPKVTRKKELEAEIVEVEKRNKEQKFLREKQQAEQEYLDEKEKLDKALAMEIIDQDVYNSKLATHKKKLDNFETIRKLELQVDMGILTEEEKNAQLYEILN